MRVRSLKRAILELAGGIAAYAICGSVNAGTGLASLVPDQPSAVPDYFCTFNGQAYYHPKNLLRKLADMYARQDPNHAQATLLNEETLLGSNGLARTLFPQDRKGLYFLLDDGWDVPIVKPQAYYGSLILDTDKFPSFTGTPAERLRKLNQAFKDLGWRGIGLWVACQESPAILKQQAAKYGSDRNAAEPLYWVERMKWMAEAGVEYWKVDWGAHDGDVAFRQMLTRLAEKYTPNLRIENACVCAPFNTPLRLAAAQAARAQHASWVLLAEGEQGLVSPQQLAQFRELVPISHVLRLYDVTAQLGIPTMLDRVAQVLASFGPDHPTQCLLNCEFIPYISAGLGCSLGIMQQPEKNVGYPPQVILAGRETCDDLLAKLPPGQTDVMRLAPLYYDRRMLEIVRTLRWQRIAPPFPVGGHTNYISPEFFSDSWDLRSPPCWYSGDLKDVIVQRAPAVIGRNIAPVTVEASPTNYTAPNLPYVLASRYPNGAIAIATLGRVSPDWGYVNPGAVIRARVGTLTAPVGLFGLFYSVTLEAEDITTNMTVWAQDLAKNRPVDITSQVRLQRGSLTIPGSVARELCPSFNDFDFSEPGIVLVLRNNMTSR